MDGCELLLFRYRKLVQNVFGRDAKLAAQTGGVIHGVGHRATPHEIVGAAVDEVENERTLVVLLCVRPLALVIGGRVPVAVVDGKLNPAVAHGVGGRRACAWIGITIDRALRFIDVGVSRDEQVGIVVLLSQAVLGQLTGNSLFDIVLGDRAAQEQVLVAVGFHLRLGKVEGAVLAKVDVITLFHINAGEWGTTVQSDAQRKHEV